MILVWRHFCHLYATHTRTCNVLKVWHQLFYVISFVKSKAFVLVLLQLSDCVIVIIKTSNKMYRWFTDNASSNLGFILRAYHMNGKFTPSRHFHKASISPLFLFYRQLDSFYLSAYYANWGSWWHPIWMFVWLRGLSMALDPPWLIL